MLISTSTERPLSDPAPLARVWRWRLGGDPIPVEATVDAAHAIYAALNNVAAVLFGSSELPPDLHADAARGRTSGRQEHVHAFVLPEDLDGDGRLDHCAVVSPEALGGRGLSPKGLAILAACRGFWIGGVGDAWLEPVFLGRDCPSGTDRPSCEWRSMTPFLPPHHRKDAATQLAQSLEALGYPAPAAIELIASPILREAKAVALPGFVPRAAAARRWARLALPESSLACWRIVFAGPVAGPVLLGQFSHFGLGRFVPADWRPLDTSL